MSVISIIVIAMAVFKGLMWKLWVVRRRRYIQTFIELAIPICLIIVLFILKEPMVEKAGGSQVLRRAYPDMYFSLDKVAPPTGVIFYPASKAAIMLMVEVQKSLNRSNDSKPLQSLPVPNKSFGIGTLIKLGKTATNSSYAYVEFQNMEHAPNLSKVLNYTVQMLELTRKGQSVQYQKHFEKFENVPLSFLALQWAIDSSYIKLRANITEGIQNVIFEPLSQEAIKPTTNKMFVSTVIFVMTYISFAAPMLPFIFLINRLIDERATGIQELVKMIGVTPSMLGVSQFLTVLPTCLLYCTVSTILLKSTDEPMIPYTNAAILFISQFLHFMTMIAMAYACTFICSDASTPISTTVFVYLGMWLPIRILSPESKSDFYLFLHGLCPHCPAYWFWNEVLTSEVRYEMGLQFNNIHRQFSVYENGAKNACVLVSFLMQLLQIAIFYALSWYLEQVKPGKYGIALPWNFLCKKEYWKKSKQRTVDQSTTNNIPFDPSYQKYFETPPNNLTVGISIQNISKIFGSGRNKYQALNNVSFDIYKGEITVLLGHNGAGKTTLISIITGMIKQSSGNVYVEGKDTLTCNAEVRRLFGFCPQHNLFCPDMNVFEHLIFFSLIKGSSLKEATNAAISIMTQMELLPHANDTISNLSGGMLRRLQLGCALTGNASVLILDEPTSGLDVEARRELWDTLMSLRGNRTLVLTTHFMEEADVLGDRVIALHLGKLRCHATPMFLKKAVGSGFRIFITGVYELKDAKITDVIKSVVPETVLRNKTKNSLEYVLPAGVQMTSLFNALENKQTELGIASIGTGVTTLEEVFLELCCDAEDRERELNNSGFAENQIHYHSGCIRVSRQIRELYKRQLDFTWANLFAFVLSHIIMPFVLCSSVTHIFNIIDYKQNDALDLDLGMYSETGATEVLYSRRGLESTNITSNMKETYSWCRFIRLEDVLPKYSESLRISSLKLDTSSYSVGVAILNDTVAKVFYTPTLKHSAPVGLNLLSNILSSRYLRSAGGPTIITTIVNKWDDFVPTYHFPKSGIDCSLFVIFNICILIAAMVHDTALPCNERLTIVRHTHIMAGCSPIVYWLVTLSYHMAWFMCFCCTAVIFAAASFDVDRTIDDQATLTAMAVAIFFCGMNIYIFMYCISFMFNGRIASLILVGMSVLFCFLLPILIIALEDLKTYSDETPFTKFMNIVGCILPLYTFTRAIMQITDAARLNSYCRYNYHLCPDLPYFSSGFSSQYCCEKGSKNAGPYNYFAFTKYGAGYSMIVTSIQIVIFTTLLLLFQYGIFDLLSSSMCFKYVVEFPEKKFQCPNTIAESKYVSDRVDKYVNKEDITADRPDVLLVNRAWKVYKGKKGSKIYALRGASFSVKQGECFGISGQNGAGKTTTFKLITRQDALSSGSILINEHLRGTTNLSSLGYCPQFFGLDEFRSGFANIRTLLILRGLSDYDVKKATTSWLTVVGMEKAARRNVAGYSGGMVRRVATVAALCGGASLTLLDEPTAGVDTAARRLVWKALRRGLSNQRAIAISSNSMDELECLCNRVTILRSGEMAVLGNPNYLKAVLAPGHTIVFKLQVNYVQNESGKEALRALKCRLSEVFDCTMKDEHMTSLHYRINKTIPYSEIFTQMELIVQEFKDLIEDYAVSETTLEDVFLAVTSGDLPPMMKMNSTNQLRIKS